MNKQISENANVRDPRSAYYAGAYPEQTQPYPGQQRLMKPVPDCGEESYQGTGQLTGRKALVTGGDSGIGRAAAIAYAREGADVALSYLPEEEEDAQAVRALIEKAGRKAVMLPGDLLDESYARGLGVRAMEALGGLDILALVAGRQVARTSIREITTEQLRDVFTINVFSVFWTLQEVVDALPAGASIILTTSTQGFDPSPQLVDYAATKAALRSMAESLGKQLAKDGIRVNGIAPGPVWTPLQVSGGQLEAQVPHFGESVPMGRAGEPVELAGLYVYLASNQSSYVTATTYGVGGGARFG